MTTVDVFGPMPGKLGETLCRSTLLHLAGLQPGQGDGGRAERLDPVGGFPGALEQERDPAQRSNRFHKCER